MSVADIPIQLPRESQAGADTTHDARDELRFALSCCNSTEGIVYLVQVSELGLLDLEAALDDSVTDTTISGFLK